VTSDPEATDPLTAFPQTGGGTRGHHIDHQLLDPTDTTVAGLAAAFAARAAADRNTAHAQSHNAYIDVQAHFGAKYDGVTDDTVSHQDAFQACADEGGGKVVLGHGEAVISEMLAVPSGAPISVLGRGGRATTIKWKTGVPAPEAMFRILPDSWSLMGATTWRGFSLNGNSIATRGLYITDTNEMTFDRLGFQGFAAGTGNDACIYGDVGSLTGCLLNEIRMCRFGMGDPNSNKGIYFGGGHGNRIISNEFSNTPPGSIHLAYGDANYIAFNDFEGLTVDGTYSLELDAARTVVVFNRFEDVVAGRPDCRSILTGSGVAGTVIQGNDFGEEGAGDYVIELGTANSVTSIFSNYFVAQGINANLLIGTSCDDISWLGNMNSSGGSEGEVKSNSYGEPSIQGMTRLYPTGFKRLAINMAYPTVDPAADLDVNGQAFTNGVSTKVKAGTPVDGDFTYVEDGMIAVDSTANKIWVRIGGTWKGVVVA
jgi:hypothetical protein